MDTPIWHGHSDSYRSCTADDRDAFSIRCLEIQTCPTASMMYEHRPRPLDHNKDDIVPTGLLSKKGLEVVNFTISDLDPCHREARREESGQRITNDMRVSAGCVRRRHVPPHRREDGAPAHGRTLMIVERPVALPTGERVAPDILPTRTGDDARVPCDWRSPFPGAAPTPRAKHMKSARFG